MKKTLLLLLMIPLICTTVRAQTTSYGVGAGSTGTLSTYFGYFSGGSLINGAENSFVGAFSGFFTQGTQNVGIGTRSLYKNFSGAANAATGFETLYENTSGSFNTANGFLAMHNNTSGQNNTATGANSLNANTVGTGNTAMGNFSLYINTTGINNTAQGIRSMYSNTSGNYNTASGYEALYYTTGGSNTGVGTQTLYNNSRGEFNSAVGSSALRNNVSGNFNSALGFNAGPNGKDYGNTTAVGYNATTTAPNQIRIGNTSVTSIGGQVGWTTLSDGRFKRNIREDVSGLDFINKLRPVSYELDKKAVNAFLRIATPEGNSAEAKTTAQRQTGFIAQEVEALIKKSGYVFHGVEAPQNDGDHYSIRYAEFVVPLVKAIQELTAKVNEQEERSEAQQLEIATLKQKLGVHEGVSENSGDVKAGLFQNNPNPFSTETEIKMLLPETSMNASIIVYNLEGKQLKNILVTERGDTSVKISGNDLSAGIYLYALIVDGKVVDTKRLVLTR